MPEAFIRALIQIKAAAAKANGRLQCITPEESAAIVAVCALLLEREDLMQHFPVDIYQTGSGTSTNMNANEVIATLASELLASDISPNDHVNFGQSSNDVIPTAIHVSAAKQLKLDLIPALEHLRDTILAKADTQRACIRTGRTHLMDAMPLTMAQFLSGWAAQVDANIDHLNGLKPSLCRLAQGGTAVGTGINTHPDFAQEFVRALNEATGIRFQTADNYFALIASQDTAVTLSGQLKTVAVTFMKIANDLRWMNSGPLAGLGEISLEALQPGSSIMPGKVNPVIAESAAMVAAQVIGNDQTIAVAGQSGNFELNVMLPVIAHNLLSSLTLLARTAILLADKAIATFTVNNAQLELALHRNPVLVTALNPVIGYAQAATIAKQAYAQQRPILDVAAEHSGLSLSELEKLLDPVKLTKGGL